MRFGCECLDPTCRERLTLTEDQYTALAEAGAVVSPWCAQRDGKRAIDLRGGAVAVGTAASVTNLLPRLRGARQ